MTTKTRIRESARNKAAVAYLREVKTNLDPKVTYEEMAESTGLKLDQVKRLMNNKAEMTVDQFIALSIALRQDPASALKETLGKISLE